MAAALVSEDSLTSSWLSQELVKTTRDQAAMQDAIETGDTSCQTRQVMPRTILWLAVVHG